MISLNREERPWGRYFIIDEQSTYKLKRIEVEPGKRLSYQYHKKRSEVWTIIKGKGLITLNDKVKEHSKGDTILIPQGMKHRIENNSKYKIVFIEIQIGSYFGEDDIVRLEDDYGRI